MLPFENLSKDEENAFFAAGVQDEILTDLAKVADHFEQIVASLAPKDASKK